ncbi:hypothetical protein CVD28_01490 [Bacillus sp. M6-12]|uniref:hypothetical protein n=1 Tax=Bacillus sp. M6-12 TaxID=2054166 RepID=UPI000C76433E|nr:hypothetical protein [Bacillus sp. M6-12]PLS19108.1 hypothetical protein CVD28_01490 [Bacillus sp. M6-12]
MEKTVIGFGDFLYGYVNGDRYMVSNTVEQICAFIMKYRLNDVQIISILDQMEIETSMGFLSFVSNQTFLRETLLPALVPMQRGEVEVPEFVPHTVESDYVISNVRMNSRAGYFLGAIDFEEGFPQTYDRQSGYYETEEEVVKAYPNSIGKSEAMEMATQKGWI